MCVPSALARTCAHLHALTRPYKHLHAGQRAHPHEEPGTLAPGTRSQLAPASGTVQKAAEAPAAARCPFALPVAKLARNYSKSPGGEVVQVTVGPEQSGRSKSDGRSQGMAGV
eukprot:6202591-Pleurochrysis_carterae.AAC.2